MKAHSKATGDRHCVLFFKTRVFRQTFFMLAIDVTVSERLFSGLHSVGGADGIKGGRAVTWHDVVFSMVQSWACRLFVATSLVPAGASCVPKAPSALHGQERVLSWPGKMARDSDRDNEMN